MKSLIVGLKTAIAAYWRTFTPFGQLFLILGLGALIVDAGISFQYGITQTRLHAFGFALLAIFFAVLPDAAYREWEGRRWINAITLAILCIPIGTVAYYSHIGYGAGVRVGDIQETGVQNAKFDDARESLKSERTNLDLWRKQLADLKEQNAWAVSVTADGLRAQMSSSQKAIDLETAKGGCKAKCLALMQSKAALEARIATAEQVGDLTKRIEATQRIIDGKTVTAATTEFKKSSVVNQTNVGAQLWLALTGASADQAINPDQVTFSFVNIFIAGGGALAFMLMAPIGFFVAGRNRLTDKKTAADVREAFRKTYVAACNSNGISPVRLAA